MFLWTAPAVQALNQQNIDRIKSAIAEGLPLAGSWNMGSNTTAGYDPTWQLTAIEDGFPILPWFQHFPRQYTWNARRSYFEQAILFAAQHKLPIAFRTTQWEEELRDSAYLSRPLATNPNLQNLDGTFEAQLSPLGAIQPWYDIGFLNTDTEIMKKIQELYPDPPLVLWVSNNEPHRFEGSIEDEKRYVDQYGLGRDSAFKARVTIDAWSARYKRMKEGAIAGLTKPAWKANSKWIGYSGYSNELGIGDNLDLVHWNRLIGQNYLGQGYDGVSVSCYVHPWSANRDHYVRSPQAEAGNVKFAIEKGRQYNPNFIAEVSPWEGGPDMIKRYVNDGQSFTSARYRGYVEALLWTIRPPFMREYRNSTETRNDNYYLFKEVLNAVALVHNDARFTRFWKEGKLVPNRRKYTGHGHTSTTPFSYNSVPPEFPDTDRWFLLWSNVNEPIVNWYGDRTHLQQVNVFASALEIGTAPNREWLLFTHSPQMARENVTINIDGYKDVVVHVDLGGSFYFIKEAGGSITPFINNKIPVAVDDAYETVEDTPILINPLTNDSDPDGDSISIVGVLSSPNGKAERLSVDSIRYTPRKDFYGVDTFTYTVGDSRRGSKSATVSVEVRADLDAPTSVSQVVWTAADTPVTITLEATDPDSPSISYKIVDPAINGTVTSDDGDKTVIYRPRAGFTGTDSFSFSASDGRRSGNIAKVYLNVGPADPGLVGWWKMDEGEGARVLDFSSKKNNGTLIGDPLWTAGIRQGGLSLDGINDRIPLPAGIVDSAKGSFAGWINTSDNYFNDEGIILYGAANFFGGGDGFGGEEEIHLHIDSDNTLGFFLFHPDNRIRINSKAKVNDGKWRHVGATWEQGGNVVLYLDGAAVVTVPHNGSAFKSQHTTQIGRPTAGSRHYLGLLDDMRIYSRPLSAAEMAALADPTGGNTAPVVNAGSDITLDRSPSITLNGSVSDDGRPNPPLAVLVRWSVVAGPGTVTLGNPESASTTALFSSAGDYTLRLRASDGALESFDEVTVSVGANVRFQKPELADNTNLVKPGEGQSARITYNVPSAASVSIIVYGRSGERIKELENSDRPAGTYFVEWDGKNDAFSTVASGVYLAVIKVGDKIERKKIIVVK